MKTPNSATAERNSRPARRGGGRSASRPDISTAPTAGAARRAPSPCGPTCRISSAKIGRMATAPPNSTASRSSVIAPRKIGRREEERQPGPHAGHQRLGPRRPAGARARRMRATVTSEIAISAAAIAYDDVAPTQA